MTALEWLFVIAVAFLFGLAVFLVYALERLLREQLTQSRAREREATERLLGAWRDGAHIPPPPLPPPPPPEPLPSVLQEELGQWESMEHRAELEAEMRMLLARGLSPAAVLLHLDNEHPS